MIRRVPRGHRARVLLALLAVAVLAIAPDAPLFAARMSLTAYYQTGHDDKGWQKAVMEKVARKFQTPPKAPAAGKKCVVIATISKTGRIAATLVNLSSGSKPWDEASVKAVTGSSPLPPLTPKYPREALEVHFHFAVVP